MKFFKFERPGDNLGGIFLGVSTGQFGNVGKITCDTEVYAFSLTKDLVSLCETPAGKSISVTLESITPLISNPKYRYKKFSIEPLDKQLPITKCPDCACPGTRGSTENCNDCMSGSR